MAGAPERKVLKRLFRKSATQWASTACSTAARHTHPATQVWRPGRRDHQNAGTTEPLKFACTNAFTSGDWNAFTSLATQGLSLSAVRTASRLA